MRRLILCVVVVCCVGRARAEVIVPGFNVDVYAGVPNPSRLSFAPSGDLYVGSGGDPARIHRVSPGGTPVVEYGNSDMRDPDSVLFDPVGLISGTAGSVLVAGGHAQDQTLLGHLSAVLPDQNTIYVVGPSPEFYNINDMKFDRSGRLLATDAGFNQVLVSSGGSLEVFATLPTPAQSLAIDSTNRIFVSGYDGVIRIYNPDGTIINESFASGLSIQQSMEFGPGGDFGQDLYVRDGNQLLRFDPLGNPAQLGTGFNGGDLAFGPNGALYVSEPANNRILRITSVPEPSTLALLGAGAVGLFGYVWRRRRKKPPK